MYFSKVSETLRLANLTPFWATTYRSLNFGISLIEKYFSTSVQPSAVMYCITINTMFFIYEFQSIPFNPLDATAVTDETTCRRSHAKEAQNSAYFDVGIYPHSWQCRMPRIQGDEEIGTPKSAISLPPSKRSRRACSGTIGDTVRHGRSHRGELDETSCALIGCIPLLLRIWATLLGMKSWAGRSHRVSLVETHGALIGQIASSGSCDSKFGGTLSAPYPHLEIAVAVVLQNQCALIRKYPFVGSHFVDTCGDLMGLIRIIAVVSNLSSTTMNDTCCDIMTLISHYWGVRLPSSIPLRGIYALAYQFHEWQ